MKVLSAALLSIPLALTSSSPQAAHEAAPPFQPFRISDNGAAGPRPDVSSAVACNSIGNEYLVVWNASQDLAGRVFGQRIDAATGSEIGPNDFAISGTGATGAPAVAYNSALNEFLVVWNSVVWDPASSILVYKVLARRVAADGSLLGTELPIGGSDGNPPALAYNATTGEYLMTHSTFGSGRYCDRWLGNVCIWWVYYSVGTIQAQRLDSSAVLLSSTTVASNSRGFAASSVVWNPLDNEYLVVFTDGPAYAARIDGNTGAAIARFLAVGTAASGRPSVAHNTRSNQYLVVWGGVHGQLLTAAGVQTGANDFRIDDGTGGSLPSVAYNSRHDQYLVTWDTIEGVRGQRLSATGAEIGADDFPLTPAGYKSKESIVTHDAEARQYFVTMASTAPFLPEGQYQLFGYRYVMSSPFVVGMGRGSGGEAQAWEIAATGFTRQTSMQLPWPAYNTLNGELHPAVGDVDGDGLNEVVVGLGRYGDGWMAVFDDADHGHALLTWVQLPWPSYNGSNGTMWPSVGDIDGDGKAEIVAGLGSGGQGFYAIFDDAAHGYAFLTWRRVNWSWYNTTQSGETRPAVANIDGGSFSEIVIGLGPGGGGWMEVVDDAEAGYAHLRWLRVGWSDYISGPGETFPAAGDVDGDGYDEIVVGLGPNSQGWLQVFDDAFDGLVHKGWLRASWSDYANVNGETHPAVGDIDGDAAHEIVLGLGVFPGQGGWFEVRDDFTTSFASLGWRNVGRTDFYYAGGATFPAIGRAR